MKFKDINIGQLFTFIKLDSDYKLRKTGTHSWVVVSSNCKTYKVGQGVSATNEKTIARLNSLKVVKVNE